MKYFAKTRAGLLIVLPVLILSPFYTALTTDALDDLLTTNLQKARPIQALYHLEVLASEKGWTGDLAHTAGDLWAQLGDLNRATAYWETAARLNPADASVLQSLAQAQLDLQHWSEATLTLNRLLELNPDDEWAHYYLGVLQVAFTPEGAAENLEFVRHSPAYQSSVEALLAISSGDSAERAMQVGIVLIDHDLWGVAEMVFQYAALIGDPFPESLAYVGLARDYQGKSGRTQFEQALTLNPQASQVHYLYGLHLRLMNDIAGSLNAFQQAVKLDPLNPAYAAEFAVAYQQAGDFAQAEYWFKQALTLSGNDARFQELLTQFYSQIPAIGN